MPALLAKEVEQPIGCFEMNQVNQLKTPMPAPTA
jgi:hypothetical protein